MSLLFTPDSLSQNMVRELISDKVRYAHVITFGCQQNEADSEKIRAMALGMGYKLADDAESADLIIVNTCAIRRHAEMKALSMLGRFKALKKQNPDLILGIAGCMAAEPGIVDMIKKDFHYVSFTVEPSSIHKIPSIVEKILTERKRFFSLGGECGIFEGVSPVRNSSFKAWVSIIYGCNNFCSYCIVPYVRGRERSRKSEDVIEECRALVSAGYKEITLLGQNVNSYKSDLDFAELLDAIAKIEGDFIIRFMTSHPKDVSDRLIDVLGRSKEKIAPYFHLPLQAGSDRILGLMNRRYTLKSYLEIVDKLRSTVPGIAISSDIIVGFPTETEEEFLETLSALERVRFDMVYAFIYSPREGTRAATMEGQVSDSEKSERLRRLLELQTEISLEKNQPYVGSLERVLVDSCDLRDGVKIYNARTLSNKLVHFTSDECEVGQFKKVKIERAGAFDLFASDIKEECEE